MNPLPAIAALLNVIPGWMWAVALVGAILSSCGISHQRDAARLDAAGARTALAQERMEGAVALARVTQDVLQAQGQLQDAHAKQELKDADAKNTIESLREDLRRRSRAAGGHGLRDPFASACSGQPAAAAPAAADGGAADPAGAGRQLSVELEEFLIERFTRADEINVAYASCRVDAIDLREKLRRLQDSVVSPRPVPQVPAPP